MAFLKRINLSRSHKKANLYAAHKRLSKYREQKAREKQKNPNKEKVELILNNHSEK